MKISFLFLIFLVLSPLILSEKTFAANIKVKNINISEVWARSSFSMAKSAAAYLTIRNDSRELEQLISVKSPIAQKTEIHQIQYENDVMKMSSINKIDIPAKSTTVLKPGGKHVMFFGLNSPLEEGSHFPLILEFDKAGKVEIMVNVLKYKALDNKKRKHHKH